MPTDLGMKLTQMLDEAFPKINANSKFTAHMELDLDKIAQGEMDRDTLLMEFWNSFEKDLANFKGAALTSSKKTVEVTNIICPQSVMKKIW